MENEKNEYQGLDDVELARKVNERLGLEDSQDSLAYKGELKNLSLT